VETKAAATEPAPAVQPPVSPSPAKPAEPKGKRR